MSETFPISIISSPPVADHIAAANGMILEEKKEGDDDGLLRVEEVVSADTQKKAMLTTLLNVLIMGRDADLTVSSINTEISSVNTRLNIVIKMFDDVSQATTTQGDGSQLLKDRTARLQKRIDSYRKNLEELATKLDGAERNANDIKQQYLSQAAIVGSHQERIAKKPPPSTLPPSTLCHGQATTLFGQFMYNFPWCNHQPAAVALTRLIGYYIDDNQEDGGGDPRESLTSLLGANWKHRHGRDDDVEMMSNRPPPLSMACVSAVGGQGKTEFCRAACSHLARLPSNTFPGIEVVLPLMVSLHQTTTYSTEETGHPFVWRFLSSFIGGGLDSSIIWDAVQEIDLQNALDIIRSSFAKSKNIQPKQVGIVVFVDEVLKVPEARRNELLKEMGALQQKHILEQCVFTQFIVTSLEVTSLSNAVMASSSDGGGKQPLLLHLISLPMISRISADEVQDRICKMFQLGIHLNDCEKKVMIGFVGSLLSACGHHFRTLERALAVYWSHLYHTAVPPRRKCIRPLDGAFADVQRWFESCELQYPTPNKAPSPFDGTFSLCRLVHFVAPQNKQLWNAAAELFVKLIHDPMLVVCEDDVFGADKVKVSTLMQHHVVLVKTFEKRNSGTARNRGTTSVCPLSMCIGFVPRVSLPYLLTHRHTTRVCCCCGSEEGIDDCLTNPDNVLLDIYNNAAAIHNHNHLPIECISLF